MFADEALFLRRGRDPPRASLELFRWRARRALCYLLFMAISKELLEILVCPLCKTPVHPTTNGSGLKCEKCSRVYPIKDDIPVMLVDEAKIEA